jgi:hypothetical protein
MNFKKYACKTFIYLSFLEHGLPTELELNFVDILTNPTICYVFHASIHYRERERDVYCQRFLVP